MSVVDIAAAAIIQSLAGPVDGSDLLNLSNQLPGRWCRSSPTVMTTNYQDLIVLFGDSLTQMSWGPELDGIGARLASASILIIASKAHFISCNAVDLYARKLDVLNRGFSGYNTDWALPVWEQVRQYDVNSFTQIRRSERDLDRSWQSTRTYSLTPHACGSLRSGSEQMMQLCPGSGNMSPFPGFQRTLRQWCALSELPSLRGTRRKRRSS